MGVTFNDYTVPLNLAVFVLVTHKSKHKNLLQKAIRQLLVLTAQKGTLKSHP